MLLSKVDITTILRYNSLVMREPILRMLQQKEHVSGETLAHSLGISRTAVWKHVNILRRMGYEINSSPHFGYSFIKSPDLLFPDEINCGLSTSFMGKRILYSTEVTSTQDVAGKAARRGEEEGTIAIAEKQSRGRGRKGRHWISPIHSGIYLSVILRPSLRPDRALQLPLIAGVAVIRAIKATTKIVPTLKWPNDIMVNGKKAGGILAEISSDTDEIHYIVLGIGLNVNVLKSHFPSPLQETVTSLMDISGHHVSRVRLVRCLLSELESIYLEFLTSGFDSIRKEWLSSNNTINSEIKAVSGPETIEGKAIDIDKDGFLLVKEPNGHITKIISGDVLPPTKKQERIP
ncbi:MAG TPA: biotin--[acetyl-CoA-carboxylase] ligase [Dehalococcoidia bacterium]|nr:biotin--[acetyl-CoA-carboxylase] ligase [Dehalococcoidia bacterium]